jgi:hypothetical protein
VRFGERSAFHVELVSSSEVRVVTPRADAPGKVGITVTVNGESRQLDGIFEYIEPLPEIDVANPGQHGFTILGDGERRVGESMALGDITGDGAAELIITLTPDGEGDRTWGVGVIHGGIRRSGVVDLSRPSAGVTLIDLSVTGDGGVVRMVGDVNGDGIDDLGLGATGGHGVILFGRPELPLSLDAVAVLASGGAAEVAVPGSFSHFHFIPAGDVDGDGIGDVAISHYFLGGTEGPGEVILLAGRHSWPRYTDLTGAVNLLGRLRGAPAEGFGSGLTQAGDVNGDGRPDLLVSTDTPRRAYLIFGPEVPPGDRLVSEYVEEGGGVAFDLEGGPEGRFDSPWVAGPGDVDGDGLADVLLGLQDSHVFAGVTYLVPGGRDLPRFLELPGFPGTVEFLGPGSDAQSGQVGPAGDFNADGLDDFLIRGFRPTEELGDLFLIFGARDFPASVELGTLRSEGIRIEGTIPVGVFSVVVRERGDLDGDGGSDIAFSERGINDTLGRVHVVFGLTLEPVFVRGDANFDDAVGISDAIFTLRFLFQAGVWPACEDAADTDDTGSITLTDVVRLLNHLFRSGPPPPPPYPEAGRDPTDDSLSCLGF